MSRISAGLAMVGEQGDEDDKRNRHAEQVKKNGSHNNLFLKDLYSVALPATQGGRITGAESADEEGQKCPQQKASRGPMTPRNPSTACGASVRVSDTRS